MLLLNEKKKPSPVCKDYESSEGQIYWEASPLTGD